MEYLGTKVGTGYGLGKVLIINDSIPEKLETELDNLNPNDEINKLNNAINEVTKNYESIKSESTEKDIQDLCDFYKMLLASSSLKAELTANINEQEKSAIGSVLLSFHKKEVELSNLDNAYLRERSKDIKDVSDKLVKYLLGIKEINLKELKEDTIVVAKEITPSLLLGGHLDYVKGIVSEIGGKTSHVAILANTLRIPSVFGIKNVASVLKDGEMIFVNANKGLIRTNLTNDDITEINDIIAKDKLLQQDIKEMVNKKAITKDGKSFEVTANAGDITELDKLEGSGLDGIGLFRSEFLFLNKATAPSEEYLFNVYKNFAEKLNGKTMIIRTLDIGGDKKCSYINIPMEQNPFLGYRAIRYCLDNKEFFKVSLRAILRASNYGKIMIMYPMISSIDEVDQADSILEEAKNELALKNIPFDKDIKTGAMVEIPSAAIMANDLLDTCDFLSIGTNDLTQYGLAVDRGNPQVSYLYNYFNPSIIKLIKMTIDATNTHPNKFVGMCGEMAADPLGIILLVGLGLNEFSVNLASVLRTKKLITLLNYSDCKKVAEQVLSMTSTKDIEALLNDKAKEYFGKYY